MQILDSTDLESELYRLHTSFSNNKDRLLARITIINDDLHKFLDHIPNLPRQSSATIQTPFRKLQGQAQEVYDCLAKHQPCNCPRPHRIGIASYPTFNTSSRLSHSKNLGLLLETESPEEQLRVQVEVVSVQTAVELKPPEAMSAQAHSKTGAGLKRHIGLKKHYDQVSDAVHKKSTFALAAPSLSMAIPPKSDGLRPRSILKSVQRKLKKSASVHYAVQIQDVPSMKGISMQSASSSSTSVTHTSTTLTAQSTRYSLA